MKIGLFFSSIDVRQCSQDLYLIVVGGDGWCFEKLLGACGLGHG